MLQSQEAIQQPNQQPIETLIQRNIKLKNQVLQFSIHLEELLARKKQKKQYGINLDNDPDDDVKLKKLQLKRQLITIFELNHQNTFLKRQLQCVYDIESVEAKKSTIKTMEKELEQLQAQSLGLKRMQSQSLKAIDSVSNDGEFNKKMEKTKEQLTMIKSESKRLYDQIQDYQRILRAKHSSAVGKKQLIKEVSHKLKENSIKAAQTPVVTLSMIAEIEQEINQLEAEHAQAELLWQDKMKTIDAELQQRRLEEDRKLLILKEKEKEMKLNGIRTKELRKLFDTQAHAMPKKIIDAELVASPTDPRRKRNIQYLNK